jgi:hypothetical protein
MKAIIATVTIIVSVLGTRLTAADATPTTTPVEQQFKQADAQLALEQYKQLRMAAFETDLKILSDTKLSEDQRNELKAVQSRLTECATTLRLITIHEAEVSVPDTK